MMRVELDTAYLDKLGRGLDVSVVLGKLAMDCEAYIKLNFSALSPSPVGGPPGVDTGALKNSVVASPRGADWVVQVGAPYGMELEYGTRRSGARPFVLPAVRAIVKNAPAEMLKIVEDA